MNNPRTRNTHSYGVILIMISALIFSSAGIFTKGVSSGAWEIIFWRSVFTVGFALPYILFRGAFSREFTLMGSSGLAVSIVGASGTAAFIPALKLTTMANVALIYAAAPLLAALLSWLWINEKLSRNNIIGCCISFLGVFIIFQGSIGSLHVQGDLLALWMTLALALMMVIYRRSPQTPAAGPVVLSCLILLPAGAIFGEPFSVSLDELLILAAFGLTFAIAGVTLAEGAKKLPAGETALLSALETPLAPLLGWMVFMETPVNETYIGGTLVLAAVLWTQVSRKGQS